MVPVRAQKFCCGPFAQKIRRLQELNVLVEQFRSRHETTAQPEKELETLTKAQRELEIIRKWISSHICHHPRLPQSARSTRF